MIARNAAARLAAVLLATGAAACRHAPASPPVTIRLWALGREGELMQPLVRELEREHPNIRVRVQQIPWTAAHEKLLTAYVGDATPDVAQIGNTWIAEFVALGALERLDPWIARSGIVDSTGYFRGIWETNTVSGAVHGIPWYVDTRVVFYRKDLLARAGYDSFPATWSGWLEAMRAVKRRSGPNAYAIFLPTDEWAQPILLAMQAGSPLLRDHDQYGAFEGPPFRRAFELYVSLFREGLAPAVSNQTVANAYQEFARGAFAMWITGPWNIGEFRRRLPPELQDDWGTAPLPGPDGEATRISLAGGSSLVIFRRSRHVREAWQVIEFLSRPDVQRRFFRITGDLPARVEAWQDSALLGDPHARAFWVQLHHVRPTPKIPEWEQLTSKVIDRAESAIRGRAGIEAALAGLDRDADALLEKRRWMLQRAARSRTAEDRGGP